MLRICLESWHFSRHLRVSIIKEKNFIGKEKPENGWVVMLCWRKSQVGEICTSPNYNLEKALLCSFQGEKCGLVLFNPSACLCINLRYKHFIYLFLKPPPFFSEKCYILYNFFKSDKTQLPAQRSKRPSAKWDLINLMSMFWEHIWLEKSLNRMHIRLLNATMMCVIANLSCNSLARAVYLHYRFREWNEWV